MEKVQWNSIDKNQNGLKYSKNDKSSTLPRYIYIQISTTQYITYSQRTLAHTTQY